MPIQSITSHTARLLPKSVSNALNKSTYVKIENSQPPVMAKEVASLSSSKFAEDFKDGFSEVFNGPASLVDKICNQTQAGLTIGVALILNTCVTIIAAPVTVPVGAFWGLCRGASEASSPSKC